MVLGVGNYLDEDELKAMSSDPVEIHSFMVEDYSALESIQNSVASKVCTGIFFTRQYYIKDMNCNINFKLVRAVRCTMRGKKQPHRMWLKTKIVCLKFCCSFKICIGHFSH